jgi:hypothetical protein
VSEREGKARVESEREGKGKGEEGDEGEMGIEVDRGGEK